MKGITRGFYQLLSLITFIYLGFCMNYNILVSYTNKLIFHDISWVMPQIPLILFASTQLCPQFYTVFQGSNVGHQQGCQPHYFGVSKGANQENIDQWMCLAMRKLPKITRKGGVQLPKFTPQNIFQNSPCLKPTYIFQAIIFGMKHYPVSKTTAMIQLPFRYLSPTPKCNPTIYDPPVISENTT